MGLITSLAQATDYWLAGLLTVVAAAIVTAMIIVGSRSDRDDTP